MPSPIRQQLKSSFQGVLDRHGFSVVDEGDSGIGGDSFVVYQGKDLRLRFVANRFGQTFVDVAQMEEEAWLPLREAFAVLLGAESHAGSELRELAKLLESHLTEVQRLLRGKTRVSLASKFKALGGASK